MRRGTHIILLVLAWSGAWPSAATGQGQPAHAASGVFNRALGVDCVHCHTPGNFADPSKPMFDFARRMERMVRALSNGPLRALGGVTCWSCHRGRPIPARIPRAAWESLALAHAGDVAGRDGLGLTMSVYAASLGVACTHCHVPGDWRNPSKAPHKGVPLMLSLFDLIPTFFDAAARMPQTQCYMCHQGRVTVERAPGEQEE